MILQEGAQGTGTHGKHRVVEGAIERLADRTNTCKRPGLGNKTPGTIHLGIDGGLRYVFPGYRQRSTAPGPGAGVLPHRAQQVRATVKTGLEHLRHVTYFLLGGGSGLQRRAVTIPRGHRQRRMMYALIRIRRIHALGKVYRAHPVDRRVMKL